MQADWIAGLNEQQRIAVTAPLENTLVLAGAGSGKTRVLVNRMAWLVEQANLSPMSLLAVTFTNKAAGELKSRLSILLNMPLSGLWVGTFHGLCHRFLRRHYQEAQLPDAFHIMDSDDQARFLKRVMASLGLDKEQWPVKQAQAFINAQKDEGLRPQHVNTLPYGPGRTLLVVYKAYEEACRKAGVVDFAELLLRSYELLRDNKALLAHYQSCFQAILVDEFQDTNTVQYAWLRLLASGGAIVMAVGDDDQSIYGWRGAKVENIERFSHDFSAVKVIRLEQNYRSTATILKAANALIDHNQARMGKSLWTEGQEGEKIVVYRAFNELEEARFVSERIKMAISKGVASDEIAILYRSNAQSRVLEEALLHHGISYHIHGGVRFFERAEVKDALAYLRLVVNENDDTAFERVINFPTRGLGEKTVDEIRAYAKTKAASLWQAALALVEQGQLPSRASTALSEFVTLIKQLQIQTAGLVLDEQMNHIIKGSGLAAYFEQEKGEKAVSKRENLQELVNAAKQFRYEEDQEEPLSLLVAFLAHASLEAGEMQANGDESSVQMMTLHSAKGLEFPWVFLVGMEEGIFPSKRSLDEAGRLEEERRLCYVGMTRAMQTLVLSYAEVRRQYGREEYHRPSRFLRELPVALFEEVRVKACFEPPVKKTYSSSTRMNEVGFELGQRVYHAKFGSGVILAAEGEGAHTRVQVNFAAHGCKWLVLAYANLVSD